MIVSPQERQITLKQEHTDANEPTREKESGEPVENLLHEESEVPLLVRDAEERQRGGDAQDEKDKSAE